MIQCLNCRGCPGIENLSSNGPWEKWGDEYNEKVTTLATIKLLVILESPYKIRATGIALCKPTWFELLDDQYSALPLLCGLGIYLKKAAYNVELLPTPKEFFLKLTEKGLVFANALNVKTKKKQNCLKNPYVTDWLPKATYAIQCGEDAHSIHCEDQTHFHIVHPSSQCKSNPNSSVSSQWYASFGYGGALLDVIKTKNSKAYPVIKQIVEDINKEL